MLRTRCWPGVARLLCSLAEPVQNPGIEVQPTLTAHGNDILEFRMRRIQDVIGTVRKRNRGDAERG